MDIQPETIKRYPALAWDPDHPTHRPLAIEAQGWDYDDAVQDAMGATHEPGNLWFGWHMIIAPFPY